MLHSHSSYLSSNGPSKNDRLACEKRVWHVGVVALMPVVQRTVIQIAAALVEQDMVHQILMALLDQWLNLSMLKRKRKKTDLKCDYFNAGMQRELKIIWCIYSERGDLMLDFSCVEMAFQCSAIPSIENFTARVHQQGTGRKFRVFTKPLSSPVMLFPPSPV